MAKKAKFVQRSIVKKYLTKSIAFDIETPFGNLEDKGTVRLIGTFMPEDKTVQLDHIGQLQGQKIKLEKVLALATSLTDLVAEITHKEHLRELAEGFGESIKSHKDKK